MGRGALAKVLDHLVVRPLLRRSLGLVAVPVPVDAAGLQPHPPLRPGLLRPRPGFRVWEAPVPAGGLPPGPAEIRVGGGAIALALRLRGEDGAILPGMWEALRPCGSGAGRILAFVHPRVSAIRLMVEGAPAELSLTVRPLGWPGVLLGLLAGDGRPTSILGRCRLLLASPLAAFRGLRNVQALPMALPGAPPGPGEVDVVLAFYRRLLAVDRGGSEDKATLPVCTVLLLPHARGWDGYRRSLESLGGAGLLVAGWCGAPPDGLPAGTRVTAAGSGLDGPWWGAVGAAGTWVVPLRAGDRLAEGWCGRLGAIIAGRPGADLIYGDEDRLDAAGRHGRADLKPDWSPETLLGGNFLGRALAVRGDLWIKAGGWEGGGGDAAFHSCAERCAAAAGLVAHLPLVQLHRGAGPGGDPGDSLAVAQAGCRRRGIGAEVVPAAGVPGRFLVRPGVRGRPLVSVIIPTRDGADILRVCLETLFARTGYQEFEVLVVDNGSVQEDTRRLFAEAQQRWPGRFRILPLDIPFNYSRLNNVAAEAAAGEHLLLLNNDIEIIEPGWLEAMLGWAQLPGIGFVGAKLLYPDRSVQHIGVTVGIGGGADHLHKSASRHAAGYQGCLQTVCNWTSATAACLLVPRPVWRQVGGLDESFAVAFNDVDFCLRVGAAGYRGVVTPAAELIHHESKSRGLDDTPAKRERFIAELSRLRQRWGTGCLLDPMLGELISRGSTDPDLQRPCLSAAP